MYLSFIQSGLCGAVHTGVARYIRNDLQARQGSENAKLVCVGDKSRSILQRTHGDRFIASANEVSYSAEVMEIIFLITMELLLRFRLVVCHQHS